MSRRHEAPWETRNDQRPDHRPASDSRSHQRPDSHRHSRSFHGPPRPFDHHPYRGDHRRPSWTRDRPESPHYHRDSRPYSRRQYTDDHRSRPSWERRDYHPPPPYRRRTPSDRQYPGPSSRRRSRSRSPSRSANMHKSSSSSSSSFPSRPSPPNSSSANTYQDPQPRFTDHNSDSVVVRRGHADSPSPSPHSSPPSQIHNSETKTADQLDASYSPPPSSPPIQVLQSANSGIPQSPASPSQIRTESADTSLLEIATQSADSTQFSHERDDSTEYDFQPKRAKLASSPSPVAAENENHTDTLPISTYSPDKPAEYFSPGNDSEYSPHIDPVEEQPDHVSPPPVLSINRSRRLSEASTDISDSENIDLQEKDNNKTAQGVAAFEKYFNANGIDSIQDLPSIKNFVDDITRHNLDSVVYNSIEEERKRVEQLGSKLQREYLELRSAWLQSCDDLDSKFKKTAVSASLTEDEKDVDSLSVSSPNGRRGRRGGPVSDSVRSEAEFLEVLASLEAETALDPLVRAMRTAAKIPDMILDENEKERFVSYTDVNNKVLDKAAMVKRLATDAEDNFTPDDHKLYIDAYLNNPKQFGKIAKELGDRYTFHECVLHYYRTKKETDYKALLAAKLKRSGSKKTKVKKSKSAEPEPSEDRRSIAIKLDDSIGDETLPNNITSNVEELRSKEQDAISALTDLHDGFSGHTIRTADLATTNDIWEESYEQEKNGKQSRKGATSSYWNVHDIKMFPILLAEHGSNWKLVAEKLESKTSTMAKNYFVKHGKENGWDVIVEEANKRLSRSTSDDDDIATAMSSDAISATSGPRLGVFVDSSTSRGSVSNAVSVMHKSSVQALLNPEPESGSENDKQADLHGSQSRSFP
ncbi:hypothetical protein CANCADRAFT_43592 [Tortispora caseinolytica NRRL Y-17796]|uniref:SANT domain-containing protein n=1 Tax=Tortispora caseinolytica NRRL Y-17796 TaxID=767744 RepID=A0A1E4TDZ9_9ASCO|nr:hypothetical protein CANCADRAFT_43592 [Tortispora caseinolytica NRRL Y-17796]